jgi:hypothetical protein
VCCPPCWRNHRRLFTTVQSVSGQLILVAALPRQTRRPTPGNRVLPCAYSVTLSAITRLLKCSDIHRMCVRTVASVLLLASCFRTMSAQSAVNSITTGVQIGANGAECGNARMRPAVTARAYVESQRQQQSGAARDWAAGRHTGRDCSDEL